MRYGLLVDLKIGLYRSYLTVNAAGMRAVWI
jgi:hypothetical protein